MKYAPIYSRFQLFQLYGKIAQLLQDLGIDYLELQSARASQERLYADRIDPQVKAVLEGHLAEMPDIEREDHLHHIRALSHSMRYCLQGQLQVASLLLKEHLPCRQDIRKQEFRQPTMHVPQSNKVMPIAQVREKLLEALVQEPTTYLNALIFEALQIRDFSGKLTFRKHGEIIAMLEKESLVWSKTHIDIQQHIESIKMAIRLCNITKFAMRNEDSLTDREETIKSIAIAIYSVSLFNDSKQHPMYRFINDTSDLLASTVAMKEFNVSLEEMMLDLQPDVYMLASKLKESSASAANLFERFSYGQLIYHEILEHLRTHNSIIVADTNDIIRRFCMVIKKVLPVIAEKPDSEIYNKWISFLGNSKIMATYQQHQLQ